MHWGVGEGDGRCTGAHTLTFDLIIDILNLNHFDENPPTQVYSDSVPAAPFYTSSGFYDELAWAACWLAYAEKVSNSVSSPTPLPTTTAPSVTQQPTNDPTSAAPTESPVVSPTSDDTYEPTLGETDDNDDFSVADVNPFDVPAFYVNPSYQRSLNSSIELAGAGGIRDTLESMRHVPSAYWIDVKAKLNGSDTSSLEGILMDAASYDEPPLCVFMVYDLPNRDCNAHASNGEICCTYNDDGTCDYGADGDCAEGIAEYKGEYIDPFAAIVSEYDGVVPMVLVIEPDSLPNLATNWDNPHCGNDATSNAYSDGIEYAVKTLATACPNSCTLYVDAAHGGWLGWDDNMEDFVTLIAAMGIESYIRGFATNVANYQTIGVMCASGVDCKEDTTNDACCEDPCGLLDEWNRANNEMNYASRMYDAMTSAMAGFDPHFVIDSGRNGQSGMRSSCSNWCNIRGAGVGHVPTIETDSELVDALFWLKTPGESDGCTEYLPSDADAYSADGACPRYDTMCGSDDSLGSVSGEPYAPEAGHWFHYQIMQLAENANMVWGDDDGSTSGGGGSDDGSDGGDDDFSVADVNPFDVPAFYVNPSYQRSLNSSIELAGAGGIRDTLESMRHVPSAYWIDVKAKLNGSDTSSLEGILMDAASYDEPPLCVFMVYDLPNRDCNAHASNGEICCTYNDDGTCDYGADGDCAEGIAEYKGEYIDPFAAIVSEYDGVVPMVLVIEPDSLPNLATNWDNPHCGNDATSNAYSDGIEYAVKTLATACPNSCTLYVDAAHGGWLGWDDNMEDFVTLIAAMGIESYIRGFATNVANYQTIGVMCASGVDCKEDTTNDACCEDPCGLLDEWNRANNEMNYASRMYDAMTSAMAGFDPHFVIDSGRNGQSGMRSSCSNWCNIRGAGVGHVPTIETDSELVDALFWLKTPGESDGCTEYLPSDADAYSADGACPRYDTMCGSDDSLGSVSGEPYAPEAGHWFHYQIMQLAENANMVWGDDDGSTSGGGDDGGGHDGGDDGADDGGDHDEDAYCCYYSSTNLPCSTCESKAPSSDWCSTSDRCGGCGGDWCADSGSSSGDDGGDGGDDDGSSGGATDDGGGGVNDDGGGGAGEDDADDSGASADGAYCCYYSSTGSPCSTCESKADSSNWCSTSDQCGGCGGDWCADSGSPAPSPEPTRHPTTDDQAVVDDASLFDPYCCYYSSTGSPCGTCESKADSSNWCATSDRCGGCGGDWCEEPAPSAMPTASPTTTAYIESSMVVDNLVSSPDEFTTSHEETFKEALVASIELVTDTDQVTDVTCSAARRRRRQRELLSSSVLIDYTLALELGELGYNTSNLNASLDALTSEMTHELKDALNATGNTTFAAALIKKASQHNLTLANFTVDVSKSTSVKLLAVITTTRAPTLIPTPAPTIAPTAEPTAQPTSDGATASSMAASMSLGAMACLGGFVIFLAIAFGVYYSWRKRKHRENRIGQLPRRRRSSFADWMRGGKGGKGAGIGDGPNKVCPLSMFVC